MTQNSTFALSCEFFPPRTPEGVLKLQHIRQELQALNPAYYSVTFGAGGSTQQKTFEIVADIQANTPIPAAPHLSCVGSTFSNIRELLLAYQTAGIKRIVALRGDTPSGWVGSLGDLRYANELVSFIRQETGDYFHLEVAAYPEFHPQAKSANQDLTYFAQKVAAGANSAITQYFYNIDAYLRFMEACAARQIQIPIVPGIMPISNYTQLARFSDICKAEIPRWLALRLEELQEDKEGLIAFGLDVVTELCERLIANGAPGLHFYTLNQADLTLRIAQRLGLLHNAA